MAAGLRNALLSLQLLATAHAEEHPDELADHAAGGAGVALDHAEDDREEDERFARRQALSRARWKCSSGGSLQEKRCRYPTPAAPAAAARATIDRARSVTVVLTPGGGEA